METWGEYTQRTLYTYLTTSNRNKIKTREDNHNDIEMLRYLSLSGIY